MTVGDFVKKKKIHKKLCIAKLIAICQNFNLRSHNKYFILQPWPNKQSFLCFYSTWTERDIAPI